MGSNIVLKLPAYKMLLVQFQNAKMKTEDSLMSYAQWEVSFCGTTGYKITNAWIQGVIKPSKNNLESTGDTLLIDDGSGICVATGLSKIPNLKDTQSLKPGDKVLAVGYILNAGQGMIDEQKKLSEANVFAIIKCFKMMNISQNESCDVGDKWRSEVFEAQNALLRTISNS